MISNNVGATMKEKIIKNNLGVVFDLDGVITSTDAYHYQAWYRMAEEMGWRFTEELNQQLRGISRVESLQIIAKANKIEIHCNEIETLTERKNGYYRELLRGLSEDDIFSGASRILNELTDQNIPIALASASRNATFILEKLGIKSFFTFIVPMEHIRHGKPHPEIFLAAAEGIDCNPENCIGIEDAQAGIDGILEAGMKAIGVGDAVNPRGCDLHVRTIDLLHYEKLISVFYPE